MVRCCGAANRAHDESYEELQEKLEEEGEDLDDAWFDEHAKAVESVRQIWSRIRRSWKLSSLMEVQKSSMGMMP